MKTIQSIAFDFSVHGITPRIYGKQGDAGSRQVEISLYDRGNAWPVPNGALLALRYKLPSGVSGLYDTIDDERAMTVSENVVLVTLAAPIFTESGATSCELVITDADGGLSTWTFWVQVEASSTGSADVPEDYYNAFLGVAAQTAAAVAKAEAAAAKAEEAAGSVDASSLMSKTMYDPDGAVEAAGGIPKFVEANTSKGDCIPTSQKGVAGGVAPLNSSAKIDDTYLSDMDLDMTSGYGTIVPSDTYTQSASQPAVHKYGRIVTMKTYVSYKPSGSDTTELSGDITAGSYNVLEMIGVASNTSTTYLAAAPSSTNGTSPTIQYHVTVPTKGMNTSNTYGLFLFMSFLASS